MEFIVNNIDDIIRLIGQHLFMTLSALIISISIALPLSVFLLRSERLKSAVLQILSVLYTIPSIVLLILLLPLFGLNQTSVIVALVIYTQIILVRNMVVGFNEVPAAILEAAKGMGMSSWQSWRRVQIPLALPVIIAGVRIATIVAISIATIGAKFGAGGLGTLLFDGVAQNRYEKIVIGSLIVVTIALILNQVLISIERHYNKLAK